MIAPQDLRRRSRWIILGLLTLLAAYLLFFTPVRTYIDQRGQMNATEDRIEMLQGTNQQLEERAKQLQSDEEIERLAREKYELVTPGQQAYAVMPPPAQPTPAAPPKKDGLWDKIKFWD